MFAWCRISKEDSRAIEETLLNNYLITMNICCSSILNTKCTANTTTCNCCCGLNWVVRKSFGGLILLYDGWGLPLRKISANLFAATSCYEIIRWTSSEWQWGWECNFQLSRSTKSKQRKMPWLVYTIHWSLVGSSPASRA